MTSVIRLLPAVLIIAMAAPAAAGSPDEIAEIEAALERESNPPMVAATGPSGPDLLALRTSEIVYFSEFEENDGGLTATGDWEWGSYAWVGDTNCDFPSPVTEYPPPAPYSGTKMWGTVLDACYTAAGNNDGWDTCLNTVPADDSILTLSVNLTDVSNAYLYWAEWYDVVGKNDWVEIRVNGVVVHQVCDRPFQAPAGWSTNNSPIDISFAAGAPATIEFHLMTSLVINHSGWYIDNVVVTSAPIDPIFYDTFASGDTSNWSATVP